MLPEDKVWLDHIAVAVNDLDKSEKIFKDIGLSFNYREVVEREKVETSFAKFGERANLELLRPTSSDSAVAKFIEKKGEGIHHLAFMTDDLKKLESDLRAKGYQFIYEAPKSGAHGKMINFIHPKSTGGILIEISGKGES